MGTNREKNLKPHFKILTISSGRFLNNLLINRDISININDKINIKRNYKDEEIFSNYNINSVNDLK